MGIRCPYRYPANLRKTCIEEKFTFNKTTLLQP